MNHERESASLAHYSPRWSYVVRGPLGAMKPTPPWGASWRCTPTPRATIDRPSRRLTIRQSHDLPRDLLAAEYLATPQRGEQLPWTPVCSVQRTQTTRCGV